MCTSTLLEDSQKTKAFRNSRSPTLSAESSEKRSASAVGTGERAFIWLSSGGFPCAPPPLARERWGSLSSLSLWGLREHLFLLEREREGDAAVEYTLSRRCRGQARFKRLEGCVTPSPCLKKKKICAARFFPLPIHSQKSHHFIVSREVFFFCASRATSEGAAPPRDAARAPLSHLRRRRRVCS